MAAPAAPGAKVKLPIHEGVFAINKPAGITSAGVIEVVQQHFKPSETFRGWIEREKSNQQAESHNQRHKRKWRGKREVNVKIGHGGTLDPAAMGVLILGVGSGTKQLSHFLTGCTKSYETVVLFGAETDTWDGEGKIVERKPYEHVTKAMVEGVLDKFRGKYEQSPSLFSARRIGGKRLYEYAREGLPLPVEIKPNPVEVTDLEMTEWFDPGTHDYHWPTVEAGDDEKEGAEALQSDGRHSKAKRFRSDPLSDTAKSDSEPSQRTAEVDTEAPQNVEAEGVTPTRCLAPACRLRMTVSSGFYVRSLCHDLGLAVDSCALMAVLVRTQQADFELGKNVLEYADLKKGEDAWGPQVQKLLGEWVPVIDKKAKASPQTEKKEDAKESNIAS